MQIGATALKLRLGETKRKHEATRVRFSAHRCFRRDGGAEDLACLAVLETACAGHQRIAAAVDDEGAFLEYVLRCCPGLAASFTCVTQPRAFGHAAARTEIAGRPVVPAADVGVHATAVFLADTRMFSRMQMRRSLPEGIAVIDLDVIGEAADQVPARAWVPWSRDIIYPTAVPEIQFRSRLDVLLIDCPARNLGLMPNGVGYVHNALKHTSATFQTLDLDIILYHRFHVRRLFDEGGAIALADGSILPSDPWQAEHYDFWREPNALDVMAGDIDEIVTKIVEASPRVLALSIQSCNEVFSTRVVQGVRAQLPEVVILVGGFSCYNADIGLRNFPAADYMCIGEADLTVGALVERLIAGERPRNVPGVLSRFDDPSVGFIPAPMPHDLDLLEHPRYEWYPLDVYRNYNGYQLTPVIASRGCRWSRCTFCAERFYWRIRSAAAFVDEVEWLVDQGCYLFMFNESDLNGMPEKVLEICDEIIRRELKIKLTGQLRIHQKGDRAFYRKLREAGFVALRFGVDAFSENTLRLQKKGYTKATVRQNLRDCWEAGIFTEVNWVIGVPGETEADVDEGIQFILENKQYIGRVANINPLILLNGGVYWLEPEKHNIVFREDQATLYAKYPRAVPAHLWYSTEPYIDELVRKERFERIIMALHDGGFDIGPWAARIIEDVRKARRTGVSDRAAAAVATAKATATALGQAIEPLASGTEAVAESATERDYAEWVRLSEGVGPMSEPDSDAAGEQLRFDPDARSASYVFRAGSALPADRVATIEQRTVLVRRGEELFALDPDWVAEAFGPGAFDPAQPGTTLVADPALSVLAALTKGAVPELLRSVGSYNVVHYDGYCYGVPQSLGAIKWGKADLARTAGVFISRSVRDVVRQCEAAQGIPPRSERLRQAAKESAGPAAPLLQIQRAAAPALPRLMATINNYNVIEFEGWFYGLPHALGPIDLASTDVIQMEGVVRDLSREVVEAEIRELQRRAPVSDPSPVP